MKIIEEKCITNNKKKLSFADLHKTYGTIQQDKFGEPY